MKSNSILLLASLLVTLPSQAADDIRIGMIGLDTSHVVAFTKLLNDPKAKDHVPGGKVVAAFKGGVPTCPTAPIAWTATQNNSRPNSA